MISPRPEDAASTSDQTTETNAIEMTTFPSRAHGMKVEQPEPKPSKDITKAVQPPITRRDFATTNATDDIFEPKRQGEEMRTDTGITLVADSDDESDDIISKKRQENFEG